MTDTLYECPECEDRKLVSHNQPLYPTVWCNCDGFIKMEVINHD